MKRIFGMQIPEEEYKSLVEEYGEESLTDEFLETLYEYESRDNNL